MRGRFITPPMQRQVTSPISNSTVSHSASVLEQVPNTEKLQSCSNSEDEFMDIPVSVQYGGLWGNVAVVERFGGLFIAGDFCGIVGGMEVGRM